MQSLHYTFKSWVTTAKVGQNIGNWEAAQQWATAKSWTLLTSRKQHSQTDCFIFFSSTKNLLCWGTSALKPSCFHCHSTCSNM